MARLRRRNFRIGSMATLCFILALPLVAFSPAGNCMRSQTAILLTESYSDLPLRAVSSAQIMCQRNHNQPVRLSYALGQR